MENEEQKKPDTPNKMASIAFPKAKFEEKDEKEQANYYNVFYKELSDSVKYRKREIIENN